MSEKTIIQRCALLTVLFLLLTVPQALSEAESILWYEGDGDFFNSLGEHFVYETEGDHAILTMYWVEEGAEQPPVINVPAYVGGIPLTTIGWCAFDNWDMQDLPDGRSDTPYDQRKVERIVIPEGVTKLANGAFCEAEEIPFIDLPSTLKEIETGMTFEHVDAEIAFPNGCETFCIEDGFLISADHTSLFFSNPSAQAFPLPRVRRIEMSALDRYTGWQKTLVIPDSVEYVGGYNAYDDVHLESIIIPGSVVEIDDYAFYCNFATSITLGEGIRKIGAYAFAEISATTVTIPASVEWIGYEAFSWIDPEEVVLLNPDCVQETRIQYESREWRESTADAEAAIVSDRWTGRRLEIITDETERPFLRVSMMDGTDYMYVSTMLPAFAEFDEDHASDTAILISYPVELPENASAEDAAAAEHFYLTFELIDEYWWLTGATNGRDWTAKMDHGTYSFDDYHEPNGPWRWETKRASYTDNDTLLTEFYFSDLEELVAAYNKAKPDRYSLHH